MLDFGLSVSELNLALRLAAVQCAAARQLESSNRVNISGIAAVTGIPRGEVSRILKPSRSLAVEPIHGRQNITSKVLSAWHRDPDYLTSGHRPKSLKIFGGGPTFESLVRTYGQGIPVRAILDELKSVGAIQLNTSLRTVLPKMTVAVNQRITYKKIRALEAASNDLVLWLLSPADGVFAETRSATTVWSGRASLGRRKFARNAIALIRKLQTKLALQGAEHRPEDVHNLARMSVKIIYSEVHAKSAKRPLNIRQNLHRNR